MAEVLTKSADARKMALSLKNVEYGGELLQQLMSASSKMEKLHEKLNDLISKGIDDDAKYLKLVDIAVEAEGGSAEPVGAFELHLTFV